MIPKLCVFFFMTLSMVSHLPMSYGESMNGGGEKPFLRKTLFTHGIHEAAPGESFVLEGDAQDMPFKDIGNLKNPGLRASDWAKLPSRAGIFQTSEEWDSIWPESEGKKKASKYPLPGMDFEKNSLVWYSVHGVAGSHFKLISMKEYRNALLIKVGVYVTDYGNEDVMLWEIPKIDKPILVEEEVTVDY